MARSGGQPEWHGPRLLGPRPHEEEFSPIDGSCFGCGDKGKVMEFALVYAGRPAGHWLLCQVCWTWGNEPDPQTTDPLHVPAT